MLNWRNACRVASAAVFMTTVCALVILAKDWHQQRTENEQLTLQVRVLAQKSAEIIELEKAAADLMNDLQYNSAKVVTGTLSQAHLKGLAEGWDSPEFPAEELASEGQAEAKNNPLAASTHAVQGLSRLQDHLALFVETLKSTNHMLENKREILAGVPSVKPTDGWISSPYGKRRSPMTGKWVHHNGLDIAARRGSAIVAAAEGTIKHSGWKGAFGKLIEIDHGNGVISRYAHNDRLFVRKGEKVLRGQKISTVGMTGRTTGPHLHYEIHVNGRSVNPKRFLEIAPIQHFGAPIDQVAQLPSFNPVRKLSALPMGGDGSELEESSRYFSNDKIIASQGPKSPVFRQMIFPSEQMTASLASSNNDLLTGSSLVVFNAPALKEAAKRMAGTATPIAMIVLTIFFIIRQVRNGGLRNAVSATVSAPFKVLDRLFTDPQPVAKAVPVDFWGSKRTSTAQATPIEPLLDQVG